MNRMEVETASPREPAGQRPGRPSPGEYPEREASYLARVPDGDLTSLLEAQLTETLGLVQKVSDERASRPHSPGAWCLKEVLGHLSDTERILSYRALRLARGDATPLPGYEPEAYVESAGFGDRALDLLTAEFQAVRRATVALFRSLPPDAWLRTGTVAGHLFSVRALGYLIAGHELHHREALRARYLEEKWIGE